MPLTDCRLTGHNITLKNRNHLHTPVGIRRERRGSNLDCCLGRRGAADSRPHVSVMLVVRGPETPLREGKRASKREPRRHSQRTTSTEPRPPSASKGAELKALPR